MIEISGLALRVGTVPLGELGQPWREVFAAGVPVAWLRIQDAAGEYGDAVGMMDPTVLLTPSMLDTPQFAGRLLGSTFASPEAAWRELTTMPRGRDWRLATQTLVGLTDIALWDLSARKQGTTVAALAGASRTSAPIYISWGLGRTPLDDLIAAYRRQIEGSGAEMVKTALGNGTRASDLDRFRRIRSELGASIDVAIDAQAQWSFDEASRIADAVGSEPFWIEEPTRDGRDDVRLARSGATPIAMGENILSVPGFARILDDGFRGHLQPDVVRLGGFTPTLAVRILADTYGVPLAPHCYRTYSLPLVAGAAANGRLEYLGLETVVQTAISGRPHLAADGALAVPDDLGFGLRVDPDLFSDAVTLRGSLHLRARGTTERKNS